MQTVNDLLDQVKARHGIGSDYKLALYLGVVPGSVQHWRHGRSLPDVKACQSIAESLGIDADILALQVQAERAGDDDTRAIWSRIAHRLQGGAATVASAVFAVAIAILLIAPQQAMAGAAASKAMQTAHLTVLYIV